ncbi:RHS repeat-associated core domain-containing protein, partial [Cellulomonas sp. APG4]|uniref:RHS repeat-associated core domain-containing protein n=1 Tax=Cellulomonas sp. APG4 TaxID=1538656 RepID=UPI00137A3EBB
SAVGARYYDPTLGRFISVDPVMDLTDPAQWHGYSYANNNPITYTDPTGLKPMAIDGGHGVGKRTTPSNSEAAAKSAPASSSTSRGDTFRAPVSTPCVRMSYGCLNGSSGRPGRAVAGPSRANNLPPVYVVQQGTSPEQVAINAAYAKLFADEAMKNQEPWQQDLYEFTQGLDAVLGPMIPLLMAGAGSMRAAPRTAPRAAAGSAKAQFVLSPTLVGKPTASTTGSGWTRVGRWTSPAEHAAMKETGSIQWNARGVHRVATPASPSTYRNAPKGDIYVECDVPSGVLKPHSEGTSIIYGPQSLQARLPGRAQTGQVPFQNLVESR